MGLETYKNALNASTVRLQWNFVCYCFRNESIFPLMHDIIGPIVPSSLEMVYFVGLVCS